MNLRSLPLLALFLLCACSPTDVLEEPKLEGPHEVFGFWSNYQIVCTVPLTITTPFRIAITGGELTATFPAEGSPKAQIRRTFTIEELEELWGPAVERAATRSIEIFPLVQHEDYRVLLSFTYRSDRRDGSLNHNFHCRPDPDAAAG